MTVEPLLRDVPESALALWRIRELSDLYVDALVRDELGQIVFMSVFGRDGAIQQLFAAFHLPKSEGGIDRVTLECETRATPSWTVGEVGTIGDPKRFAKITGKLPAKGLFGVLSHVFVFDQKVVGPDQSEGTGWVLSYQATEAEHRTRIWALVMRLLAVPVLDHWQEALLAAIPDQIHHMDHANSPWPAIGRVQASQVRLAAGITDTISQLVRERVLTRLPEPDPVRPAATASAA